MDADLAEQSAAGEMETLCDQLRAELGQCRAEREAFAQEARRLLTHMRQQAAGPIAELRGRVENKAERPVRSWRGAISEGIAAAEALEQRIAAARAEAQRTRAALDPFVEAVQVEFSKMAGEVGWLRQEIHERLELARGELNDCVQEHRGALRSMIFEDAERAREHVQVLAGALQNAIKQAAQESEERRARDQIEVANMRDETQRLLAECRTSVGDANSNLQAVSKLGVSMIEELKTRFGAATDIAWRDATEITATLSQSIETACAQSGSIQKAGQEFTARMVHRLKEAATQSHQTLDELGSARTMLRDERESALAELRNRFAQMAERVEQSRLDLGKLGEEIQTKGEGLLSQAQCACAEAKAMNDRGRSVFRDTQAMQSQIESTSNLIRDIHAESLVSLKTAAEIQSASQEKSERLLEQVSAAGSQVGNLVHSLQTSIQQSGERAATLTGLAQKTSTIVRALAAARTLATNEHQALTAATTGAERTLQGLKYHAKQVGQLVGIIRQLYGTMDVRVERMRQRLDTADEICRAVPREIEILSDALSQSPGRRASNAQPSSTAAHGVRNGKAVPPQAPKVLPRPAGVEPLPFAQGTLGEIVQRNQKLNAWLRDVLKDCEGSSIGIARTMTDEIDGAQGCRSGRAPPESQARVQGSASKTQAND